MKRTSASRSFSEHTRSKRFLVRFALQNRQANASRTYVAVSSDEIAGLARLAMAAPGKGQVLVSGPLKDAMLRTLRAADIAGLRDFAVHAKDGDAGAFYERFDLRAAMRKRS